MIPQPTVTTPATPDEELPRGRLLERRTEQQRGARLRSKMATGEVRARYSSLWRHRPLNPPPPGTWTPDRY